MVVGICIINFNISEKYFTLDIIRHTKHENCDIILKVIDYLERNGK